MPKPLTEQDIHEAAKDYGADLEPALLWAVADVEAPGSGFLKDGRPKILFEGHAFWYGLRKRGINPVPISAAAPSVCYPRWTRVHYRGGASEYDRLGLAISYHPQTALESASWGRFQLMGYNWRGAGFASVEAMVHAHYQSERQHLRAIIRWMSGNGLLKKLAAKDWRGFTAGYNGERQIDYYSAKLEAAYRKRAV